MPVWYICICMYSAIYVRTQIVVSSVTEPRANKCMYVCMHAFTHACGRMDTDIEQMLVYMHEERHICMHAWRKACMYVCMKEGMYVCMNA